MILAKPTRETDTAKHRVLLNLSSVIIPHRTPLQKQGCQVRDHRHTSDEPHQSVCLGRQAPDEERWGHKDTDHLLRHASERSTASVQTPPPSRRHSVIPKMPPSKSSTVRMQPPPGHNFCCTLGRDPKTVFVFFKTCARPNIPRE